MYKKIVRKEKFGSIESCEDGELTFLDQNGLPFSDYPIELTTQKCPLKSPLVIHLELTRRCGLSCKHCYISAGKARDNELTTNEWKLVLDQVRAAEVLSVYLTGGDPLLRPDCLELLSYATKIGLSCNLLTNGLEFEKSSILQSIPREIFIVLSFDGISGTRILRDIPGERIYAIIEKLQQEKRAFAIQGLIFKDNIAELKQIVEWCAKNNIDFSMNDVLPIGRAKKFKDLLILESQLPSLLELETSFSNYQRKNIPLPASSVANPNIYQSIAKIVTETQRPEPGLLVAYVSSDGFLYADNYYAAEGWKSDYNLRNVDLLHAWQHAFSKERLLRIDHFTMCKSCEIIRSGGFCDLQNMAISQYLYGSEIACGVYPSLKQLKICRILQ